MVMVLMFFSFRRISLGCTGAFATPLLPWERKGGRPGVRPLSHNAGVNNQKEPPMRFELITYRLRSDCSTVELGWRNMHGL